MIEPISAALAAAKATRTDAAPAAAATPASGFAEALKTTAGATVDAVGESEKAALGALRGGADLQDVVRATVEAELAMETAVAVRNKLIESYQEIMRMPI